MFPNTKHVEDKYPNYNSSFFQYYFEPCIYNKLPSQHVLVEENITILKYVGDSKFVEYYTGLPILISTANDVSIKFSDYSDFMDEYCQYLKTPLFIDSKFLLPIDDVELRFKLVTQKDKSIDINLLITALHGECLETLKSDFENMISQDQDYAEAENMIRTFAKSEPQIK